MDRAIGFRPWEISAMVNDTVLAMHAQEVPFLWISRERATREAHYTLDALVRLDDRLQAHLDGLQIDADAGWRHAAQGIASLDAGVLFMVGALAFHAGSNDRARKTLMAATALPDGHRALVSALAWLPRDEAMPLIRQLSRSVAAEHRCLAINAARLQRQASLEEITHALTAPEASVRAAALHAVGECQLEGASNAAHGLLADRDDTCRFRAAWALALLGNVDGLEALSTIARQPGPPALT